MGVDGWKVTNNTTNNINISEILKDKFSKIHKLLSSEYSMCTDRSKKHKINYELLEKLILTYLSLEKLILKNKIKLDEEDAKIIKDILYNFTEFSNAIITYYGKSKIKIDTDLLNFLLNLLEKKEKKYLTL